MQLDHWIAVVVVGNKGHSLDWRVECSNSALNWLSDTCAIPHLQALSKVILNSFFVHRHHTEATYFRAEVRLVLRHEVDDRIFLAWLFAGCFVLQRHQVEDGVSLMDFWLAKRLFKLQWKTRRKVLDHLIWHILVSIALHAHLLIEEKATVKHSDPLTYLCSLSYGLKIFVCLLDHFSCKKTVRVGECDFIFKITRTELWVFEVANVVEIQTQIKQVYAQIRDKSLGLFKDSTSLHLFVICTKHEFDALAQTFVASLVNVCVPCYHTNSQHWVRIIIILVIFLQLIINLINYMV